MEVYEMPRSHFEQHAKLLKNPRQPILEMINGRFNTSDITIDELSEAMGVKRVTAYNRLKQPIEEWPYGQLIGACRCLSITTEELREKVRV